jgi:NADH dehydrogenase
MVNEKEVYLPKSEYPRVVIIGAGFAGLRLAKVLKNKPFQIVILDKNNFHQFQPLLYQVATSGLEPDSIVFPIRKIFRGYKNLIFRMANVEKIEAKERCLKTDIGNIKYDYLVLATGSTNNFYGMQDVEENSVGLKSIHESLDIRSLILQNLEKAIESKKLEEKIENTTVVIVGGGPAGVEMAGALGEFKKYIYCKDYPELQEIPFQIHLIEAADKPLAALSDKSSMDTIKDLKKLKIDLHLNTAVKSYDGKKVELSNGAAIKATTLIWTAGVKGTFPNGIEPDIIVRGNRIEVDKFNKVKNKSDIFAIGDIAFLPTEYYPKGHPMVAPVAIQQGLNLGKNLLLTAEHWQPFKYYDKGSLATIGKKSGVADFGKLHFRGILAWFIWSTVHLMSISGFRNKLRVGLNWGSRYFTYDKGNRLIIRKYIK